MEHIKKSIQGIRECRPESNVCAVTEKSSHLGNYVNPRDEALRESEDNEPILFGIRVIPNPSTKAPVRVVGLKKNHVRIPGKIALLADIIPYTQFNHDALGCSITVDDGGLRLVKLIRYLHEDGYSVLLENVKRVHPYQRRRTSITGLVL